MNTAYYEFVHQENVRLNEIPEIMHEVRNKNQNHTEFTLNTQDFSRCNSDPDIIWYILARGGVKNADVSYSNNGNFSVKNIIWWSWPMYTINNENELINAVNTASQKNVYTFGLIMPRIFFNEFMNDNFMRELSLLEGGLYSFDKMFHNDSMCVVWFQRCEYKSFRFVNGDLGRISSEQIFNEGMMGHESIAVVMSDSAWNTAKKNKDYLNEWIVQSGLMTRYIESKNIKTYLFGTDKDAFFPAIRILSAVRNGTEYNLPEKFKRTLNAARELIKNVNGSDLQMYTQIHDLLCRKITYEIDLKSEDNGTCVGALLKGRAKCDGYADAFYLCCGLKNLPVKYQLGKSKHNHKFGNITYHMWNMIFVNGTWRGADVTWDDVDSAKEIIHDYFNIGIDKLQKNYSFSKDFLPHNTSNQTSINERPENEYNIDSENDITRAAMYSDEAKITLSCSDKFFSVLMKNKNILWRALARGGVENCDSQIIGNNIILSNISDFDEWKYCSDYESISKATVYARDNYISEMVFVLEPRLFDKFLRDSKSIKEMKYFFVINGIEFESYQYNQGSCVLILSGIKNYNAYVEKISSLSELKNSVIKGYRSNKRIIDLWLPKNIFKQAIKNPDLIFSGLRELGNKNSISWSYSEDDSRIIINL